MDIKKEKWGDKLHMTGTFFNKYLDGEPAEDCVYGKWEPGQTSPEDHMWETDKCNENDKYLTLCQDMMGQYDGLCSFHWFVIFLGVLFLFTNSTRMGSKSGSTE